MIRYNEALAGLYASAEATPMLGFGEAAEQMSLGTVYHLFPNLGWPEMQKLVRGAAFNQAQAVLDLHHAIELLAHIKIEGWESVRNSHSGSLIFAAPHYASYRLIPAFLLKSGRRLTIVIDDLVAREQGEHFQQLFEAYARDANVQTDLLSFRYSSQPALLMGMAKDLRRGRDLLLYFDGNKSLADKREHTTPIDFLGHVVRARYGIAQVARITGTPIVPVAATRLGPPLGNKIEFGDLICPDDQGNFEHRATQKLWSGLAKKVLDRPENWEAIRYINHFLEFREFERTTKAEGRSVIAFDHRRFALKRSSDRGELFDRRKFTVTRVKGRVLCALDELCRNPHLTEASSVIDSPELLNWLLEKKIVARLYDAEGMHS